MKVPPGNDRDTRRVRLPLGSRLLLSITLSMGVLVTVLLLAAEQEFEELEKSLGSERNHAELALLREEWQRNPDYRPLSVAGQNVWVDNDPTLPSFLLKLKPGFDDEVENNGRSYSTLVAELDGHRVVITSQSRYIEDAEKEITRFLQASWILMMLAIAGIAYLLVRHLIRPIASFARKIDRLNPSERGVHLAVESSSPEIERMSRAFNRYLVKMDEYVERQHAFAAMASHELRSPLTVVQTSAELIDSLSQEPAVRQQSQRILRSSQNMDAMIRALLAVTRDHDPGEDAETFDLREFLIETLDQHRQEIRQHGVRIFLKIPQNARVTSHRELLQVVVNNLLGNAIRHSNQGAITLHWEKNRLCLQDEGNGIDESAMEDLFERGVSRGSRAGYGLGLYISRLISDKMGWRLQLSNTEQGTLACLELSPIG